MLKLLTISNLAVISHLQVEFGEGLNILSGETGSGKSIILASLGLLLGERASLDLLRTGENRAVVEGVFEIEGNNPLQALLRESGIEVLEEDLIIKREIVANGRGKVFVNNQSATINLLKTIQPHIIDVHGQGEQQSLLSTGVQTSMLDAYSKSESLRKKVEARFEAVAQLVAELESLKKSDSERLQMLDLIDYQINEIDRVQPKLEEDTELATERKLLTNAEKLTTLCTEITSFLYDDDESVIARLSQSARRLDELATIDSQFSVQSEQLATAKYTIEDAVFIIRDYADKITYSATRLHSIEERLEALERLKRKYGGTLTEVLTHYEKMNVRQDELRNSENHEKALISSLTEMVKAYQAEAQKLTETRNKAAHELEKKLKKDLSEVALEKSQFRINFNSPSGGINFSQIRQWFSSETEHLILNRLGQEYGEFYFSANKGEELRPMSAVASGGELSRLMLILKSNIAPTPYPRTLVFDEIDTGIGGRVADAVGVRLKRLAKSNQVICVTHQAQIARYADVHLQVVKTVQGQRTLTTLNRLEAEGRVNEIARMMAGANVTDISIKYARQLLNNE